MEVEEAMFSSIHDVTGRGLADYVTRPRDEWVLQWPGMVVLVITAIFWTSGVEKALKVRGSSWCCVVARSLRVYVHWQRRRPDPVWGHNAGLFLRVGPAAIGALNFEIRVQCSSVKLK